MKKVLGKVMKRGTFVAVNLYQLSQKFIKTPSRPTHEKILCFRLEANRLVSISALFKLGCYGSESKSIW